MVFWSSIEGVEFDMWSVAIEGFVESKGSVGGVSESAAMLDAIDELWKLWYNVKKRAFLNRNGNLLIWEISRSSQQIQAVPFFIYT